MTYPLEPLLAKMGNPTAGPASRALGISGDSFKRYQANGLTEDQADRLAVRAGFHPLEVWDDWDTAVEYVPDAICPECGEGFDRGVWNQVYCSKRCKDRVNARRWYADDEFRQRKVEANRAYRREVREIRARRSA